jgi:excisionase family DNA binding protein
VDNIRQRSNPNDHDRLATTQRSTIDAARGPFLPIKELAAYSGLSPRKLRELLRDVSHPIPFHRVGGEGKILVSRPEFDGWMQQWRDRTDVNVRETVDQMVRDLNLSPAR